VLRNASVHLGVPGVVDVLPRAVEFLSPGDTSDPATTWQSSSFVVFFSFHEGKAGNTLFLLAFLASGVVIAADRRLRSGPAGIWWATAAAGFLAFSLALKWQPWASRLHTPAFVVATVPVAIAIGKVRRPVRAGVLAVFAIGAVPYLLLNQSRPLVPRWSPSILTVPRSTQYFFDRKRYRAPYAAAAAYVRDSGEPDVGLLFSSADYEYPFWLAVKDDPAGPPILRHVGVERKPGTGPPSGAPPALVITSRAGDRHRIDGVEYVRVRDFGGLSALRRAESVPSAPGPRNRGAAHNSGSGSGTAASSRPPPSPARRTGP
jgi:hypothetical protein